MQIIVIVPARSVITGLNLLTQALEVSLEQVDAVLEILMSTAE